LVRPAASKRRKDSTSGIDGHAAFKFACCSAAVPSSLVCSWVGSESRKSSRADPNQHEFRPSGLEQAAPVAQAPPPADAKGCIAEPRFFFGQIAKTRLAAEAERPSHFDVELLKDLGEPADDPLVVSLIPAGDVVLEKTTLLTAGGDASLLLLHDCDVLIGKPGLEAPTWRRRN
jgi:hypothetical protein